MQSRVFNMMPGLDYEELVYLDNLSKDLSDDKLRLFISIYNGKRKGPDMILIGGIIGLLGIGGIQRFMVNQIGMGILFLLTAGLCYIGTIVDLVNYKKLAFEHNREVAHEALNLAQAINQ